MSLIIITCPSSFSADTYAAPALKRGERPLRKRGLVARRRCLLDGLANGDLRSLGQSRRTLVLWRDVLGLCGFREFAQRLLELLVRLADGTAHLRQALGAEDQQGDDRDDEQFWPVEPHCILPFW